METIGVCRCSLDDLLGRRVMVIFVRQSNSRSILATWANWGPRLMLPILRHSVTGARGHQTILPLRITFYALACMHCVSTVSYCWHHFIGSWPGIETKREAWILQIWFGIAPVYKPVFVTWPFVGAERLSKIYVTLPYITSCTIVHVGRFVLRKTMCMLNETFYPTSQPRV